MKNDSRWTVSTNCELCCDGTPMCGLTRPTYGRNERVRRLAVRLARLLNEEEERNPEHVQFD